MLNKIKHCYWHRWPYDWRPMQVWYRLKCFVWHRYTTVRPRYLGHTWCDKTELMPQIMFELLSQFIEQECSPGHVEWYGEGGHKITANGVEKYVRDEMQELYDWWHTVYNGEWQEVDDMLWAEARKHRLPAARPLENSDYTKGGLKHPTDEDREIYKRCVRGVNKLERMLDVALEARLHRLVNITPYLWT